MTLFRAIFIVVVSCICHFAESADSTYRFTKYNYDSHVVPNLINALVQDKNGHLWLASSHGLVKFDGLTSLFIKSKANDTSTLSTSTLLDVAIDQNGAVWLASLAGLNKVNPVTHQVTQYRHNTANSSSIPTDQINSLVIDQQNNIWMATDIGIVKFDILTETFSTLNDLVGDDTGTGRQVSHLTIANNELWFTLDNANLFVLNIDTNRLQQIYLPNAIFKNQSMPGVTALSSGIGQILIGFLGGSLLAYDVSEQSFTSINYTAGHRLETDVQEVSTIFQQQDGDFWIGTRHHGLFRQSDNRWDWIKSNEGDPDGLPSAPITDIYEDNQENLWFLHSGQGLSLLRQNYKNIGSLSKYSNDWKALKDNVIWGMHEDVKGRIWIGTNANGLHLIDETSQTNTQFIHDSQNTNSLSHNTVLDVFENRAGQIWISTKSGLNRYRPESEDFVRYFTADDSPAKNKMFSKLFEDSDGNLWVATLGAGAFKIPSDQEFQHHAKGGESALSSDYVTSFAEDSQSRIWIGTRQGLTVMHSKSNQVQYHLAEQEVWSLHYDEGQSTMLVGTSQGLANVNPVSFETDWFTSEQGLSGQRIYCIQSDNQFYYLATDLGLTQLSKSASHKNFYWFHGLQAGYNLNGCAKGANEIFYFSGNKGISYFSAEDLKVKASQPYANITSVKGFDEIGGGYLNNIAMDSPPSFSHDQNSLRFNLTGIYFAYSKGLHLRYRLNGLNEGWTIENYNASGSTNQLRSNHSATYTNLSPGKYRFELQYEAIGAEPSNITYFDFEVRTPWWNNIWAWLIYTVFGLLLVYATIKLRTRSLEADRRALTKQIEERTISLKLMADKATRLSEQKSHLFANVSHEFKTPLTLIMSPIDTLLKMTSEPAFVQKLLLMRRNTARLEHMVDQMLELSVLDSKPTFTKRVYSVDVVIEDVVLSFKELAATRSIKINVVKTSGSHVLLVEDSLHKILLNLLSNAIKYGPSNSNIFVGAVASSEHVELWVEDEGPGLSENEVAQINDRFTRLENALTSNLPGSGLGLSIVSELVAANSGTFIINSKQEIGTRFTLQFLRHLSNAAHSITSGKVITENAKYFQDMNFVPATQSLNNDESPQPETAYKVLIVEDNIEMRQYIDETLNPHFHCLLAADGIEGIKIAQRKQPDLVLSDVMMPKLNGYELTQQLKENDATSHIPVLLLSAKNDFDSRLLGLELTADDYLGKPFHVREVIQKIKNLIEIREKLKLKFSQHIGATRVTNLEAFDSISPKEQKFIQRFEELIEAHFENEALDRKLIAGQMAVSERQLNRKLSAICDHNFTEYLRKFRLRKSLNLANKGLMVAEVSDLVGFANPTYFSSCFKKEFKKTFKEYERSLRENLNS